MVSTLPKALFLSGLVALVAGSSGVAQNEISLSSLEPEHYRYSEAERCANCHDDGKDVHLRAVGIKVSSGTPVSDGFGWLSSVHARSQSHGYRVNTACAWCHAPTNPKATRDSLAAVPIEVGTWEGVACGACHPVGLADSLEQSLVTNFAPGTDRSDPVNYVFIDSSDPLQLNAQCQYCHHEFHGFLSTKKEELMDSGALRCVDCHMAGYAVWEGRLVERYHNMKVAANGPRSCSGEFGTESGCHASATEEWMLARIPTIKGPRREW